MDDSHHLIVPLDKKFSPDAFAKIELYGHRFQELWLNWDSLRANGINLGGTFSNEGRGKISGQGCRIETHRLKGFYVDFRFFHAPKEPTQHFRIANLIGNHCTDNRLRTRLRQNKIDWNEAGVCSEWHGFSPDEFIDTMFNGNLFHGDIEKASKFQKLISQMTIELAHHLLTFSIYNRMLVIRNLNWIMEPLRHHRQEIQLPE